MKAPRHMRLLILGVLLLSLIVYAFPRSDNGFDLSDSLIPAEQIHPGGPPRDGIPAIVRPNLVSADQAGFLQADDRVLGLSLDGKARAYPIRILNWHEVVNDRFAGQPVAITYCPLCGTGVAFSADVDGEPIEFGVSGLLYNSDVLLYDRATESLWSQLRMQAISGPRRGTNLQPLVLTHTTWKAWRQIHPHTRVLSDQTGFVRDYSADPYAGYAQEQGLYFPVNAESRRYHPKERVLGVKIDGSYKAYPFSEIARVQGGVIQDHVGEQAITVRFESDSQTARAFDAGGRELPATNGFWFAWYAFHPGTEVFRFTP